jgi:hypothetical protein
MAADGDHLHIPKWLRERRAALKKVTHCLFSKERRRRPKQQ